jgi:phage/plasmid-associated DNA primase
LMCLKHTEEEPFKQEVRNAEEGEYVSFSVGYDYPTEPSDEVLEMKEWSRKTIRNMFRNDEDMDYVMKAISRSLRGATLSNPEQIVMFLRGEGGNGKSLLMSMIKKVMGKYASNNFHSSYLQHTQKDERSTIIWGLKLRRFIAGEEPDKTLPFKADLFKNFAGGVIPARTNFATDNEDINIGCLWISSNFFVQFDSDTEQDSLRRRIRGIEFYYQFVEEKDFDEENPRHKLRDLDAVNNIETDDFKQGFMLLLLDYLKMYDKEGLIETPQIKKDTAEYFENINSKKEWFKENLEPLQGVNLSSQNLREYYNIRNGTKYSAQGFNKIMTELGYKKSTSNALTFTFDSQGNVTWCKEKRNVKCFLGIVLTEIYANDELMTQLKEAYDAEHEEEDI